jgi:hypothetical protein
MKRPLTLGVAAISCAAFFPTAAPAAAKDYAYSRRDITSFMLQRGFDTSTQCQETSFGRGNDCFRNPSLGSAPPTRRSTCRVSARRRPTHRIARNNKGSRQS